MRIVKKHLHYFYEINCVFNYTYNFILLMHEFAQIIMLLPGTKYCGPAGMKFLF